MLRPNFQALSGKRINQFEQNLVCRNPLTEVRAKHKYTAGRRQHRLDAT